MDEIILRGGGGRPRKRVIPSQGSQASPAHHSDKSRVEMKKPGLLEIVD
jgi:hypothetical protein